MILENRADCVHVTKVTKFCQKCKQTFSNSIHLSLYFQNMHDMLDKTDYGVIEWVSSTH